jgi:hypothetical protein
MVVYGKRMHIEILGSAIYRCIGEKVFRNFNKYLYYLLWNEAQKHVKDWKELLPDQEK